MSKLGAADIDRHYRRLRDQGGRAGWPLAPGTIKRAHGILHRALARGVKWGWLFVNPASAATAPRVPAPDIHPTDPHELARVFALATEWDIEFADYVVLAAATGARRSELVALRWADVDVVRGSVAISRGIVASLDGWSRRTPRPTPPVEFRLTRPVRRRCEPTGRERTSGRS